MNSPRWRALMPWFISFLSFGMLSVIAVFLIVNITWFKEHAFPTGADHTTADYRIYIFQLQLSMIKRSIGLFSGFSILLLGMASIFYEGRNRNEGNLDALQVKAAITTRSPGIIAMIIGCVLIVSTISSKDHFPGRSDEDEGFNNAGNTEAYTPM